VTPSYASPVEKTDVASGDVEQTCACQEFGTSVYCTLCYCTLDFRQQGGAKILIRFSRTSAANDDAEHANAGGCGKRWRSSTISRFWRPVMRERLM